MTVAGTASLRALVEESTREITQTYDKEGCECHHDYTVSLACSALWFYEPEFCREVSTSPDELKRAKQKSSLKQKIKI